MPAGKDAAKGSVPAAKSRGEYTMKKTMRGMLWSLAVLSAVACGPQEEEQPTTPVEVQAWRPSERSQVAPEAVQIETGEDLPVKALGPAPNLSMIETVAVCSDQFYMRYYPYECEGVSGLYSTYADHGGAWMQIITDELGYRNWGMATMNGVPLQEIYSVPIVDSYRNVVGYRRWWLADGFQSGTFYYRATSINTGAEKSDWINVR